MNRPDQPVDDKTLDAYLAGDSPFSRRYQEMSASDVPPELDAKILAAAKAPGRPSALNRWRVWSAPVALAATVVIAIAVILRGGVQQAAVQPALKETAVPAAQSVIAPAAPPPAEAPVARADKPVAPALEKQKTPSPVTVTAHKRTEAGAQRDVSATTQHALGANEEALVTSQFARAQASPPQSFAPESDARLIQNPPAAASSGVASAEPKPAAPAAKREESIVLTGARRSNDAAVEETIITGTVAPRQRAAGPHDSIPPAEKSERTLEHEARESDPREWLSYIRELRKNNDTSAADREWKKFVKAFPDYAVPADDPARPTSQ